MGEFSITHILLLAVIFLIFFGPKRLPELGKSLGESIRGFKKAISGETENQNKQNTQQISQEQEKKTYTSTAEEVKDPTKTNKS